MAVGTQLGCIAWDQKAGYLCCGGDAGLLKIIRLESGTKGKVTTFTLDEHVKNECKVTACCWNERYKKLTSSDESGHIIVWLEDHQSWQVEMINNRGSSTVADMQWACDGSRICIAYHDGAVIVGTVGGSRVWGKSLEMPLKLLSWSPTCQHILFATRDAKVYVYDADGNQASELQLKCLEDRGPSNIAILAWCANFSAPILWRLRSSACAPHAHTVCAVRKHAHSCKGLCRWMHDNILSQEQTQILQVRQP